jgi:ribosomal protein S20
MKRIEKVSKQGVIKHNSASRERMELDIPITEAAALKNTKEF